MGAPVPYRVDKITPLTLTHSSLVRLWNTKRWHSKKRLEYFPANLHQVSCFHHVSIEISQIMWQKIAQFSAPNSGAFSALFPMESAESTLSWWDPRIGSIQLKHFLKTTHWAYWKTKGWKVKRMDLKVIEQHNQIQRHAHHVWIITLPQYMFVVHTMFTSLVPYVLSSSELGDSKLIVIRCYQCHKP